MNDQRSFERALVERMEHERLHAHLTDDFYQDVQRRAGAMRQYPRWLALIKEPPMRTSSRLTVGSPLARVATIAAATLLLAAMITGAGIAGANLLAARDAIIVAQDGSGDVTTITEAVARAADGDTVLVRPGTYVEAVVIEADVTLAGDGPVEAIVVEAPARGPTAPAGDSPHPRPEAAYAMLLLESEATVSGITFRGTPSRVHARGGAPTLENLVLENVGNKFGDEGASYFFGGAVFSDGTTATLRDSLIQGGIGVRVFDDSEPAIIDNVLRSRAVIFGSFGDGSVIRGNEIEGPSPAAAIGIMPPSTALIEDNTITHAGVGISIASKPPAEGIGPVIRGNSITGGGTGIEAGSGTVPTIEANIVTDNRVGILLSRTGTALVVGNELVDNAIGLGVYDTDAHVAGNSIRGGATGVALDGATTAELTGNTIEGATRSGVVIGRGAAPTLTGNRVCDNGTDLVVAAGAEPVLDDNDICLPPTGSGET